MGSPSWASVRPAMALSQTAKEALSFPTRTSLESASLVWGARGGAVGRSAPQVKLLASTRWAMALAKVHWAAVGRKVYLSAGISSAAAMMNLVCRSVISLAAVVTGFAGVWARARGAVVASRVR